ncbi:MAG: hypothetical protein JW984_08400 [Deltaproteobacteria bacterium]|uniref:Alginate export domain-containing protein n=1 Tax=Candidatus Zymogenus saltonus TaxID=2844893 RepID=A0A9D8PNG5_9DELT|nr:hypothetical protein [Candidatus Zymogenus saltonus]
MKKFLTMTLAVVFVAVAFTAFAAETTFSGSYRVRSWSEYNFDKKLEDQNNNFPGHDNAQYDGWFDQRFRLTITHKRSEFLKAVIRVDLVEDTWGQQRNLLINNSAAGNFIDLAYIEFALPKIGTFTVGKFPETYGYGLAFSDDGSGTINLTGARWANAWGPVAVSVLYAKVADRVSTAQPISYNWDADLYAMRMKITPAEKHVIELFGGYLQDNDATRDSGLGGVYRNSWAATWNFVSGADYSADIGFMGFAYTGNIADMIDIAIENSYIIGHATRHYGAGLATSAVSAVDSASITGWNVYADVSYYKDLLRVGLAFIMGSGQHHYWNDNVYNNINMNYISADKFAFNKIIVGDAGTNSIWRGRRGPFDNNNNIENITAVKLYFEICPVEKLTLNGSVTWANWTEDVGQNNLGTRAALVTAKGSAYPHPAANYGNYNYQSWDADDDLGWEVDFGFSYEIMEGLTYSLSAGVLFTGDSWDYEKADGTRGDWGEIWSVTNVLTYKF